MGNAIGSYVSGMARGAGVIALCAALVSGGASHGASASAAGGRWQDQLGTVRVAVQGDQADPDRIADWTGY